MRNLQSIPREKSLSLPDFCNLGVALRILLIGNLALGVGALVAARPFSIPLWLDFWVTGAALVEPVLIASLVVLCPLRRFVVRLPYGSGVVLVVLIEAGLTLAFGAIVRTGAPDTDGWPMAREVLLAVCLTLLLLYYFALRARAFNPALAEARLAALQARIRPHFLFNSLTAVLSLIRSEPRRAERTLEDLADLFRVLLRDERRVVRLADEIELCKRYLAIETLRLGERLKVEWVVDDAILDTAIPPLVLQPLAENAVHHGIEPGTEPGTVMIRARRTGGQVEIEISNPRIDGNTQPPGRSGNHMALDNVRERLALHFDVEARLETAVLPTAYRVRILLPDRPARIPSATSP